jgi:hypothetical protein
VSSQVLMLIVISSTTPKCIVSPKPPAEVTLIRNHRDGATGISAPGPASIGIHNYGERVRVHGVGAVERENLYERTDVR